MWIAVNHYRMSIEDLAKILKEKYNFATNINPTDDPKDVDELCILVTENDIMELRHEFDVMILDRSGKDYLYLDDKGKRFGQY
jgi:hypothetical protein